METIWLEVDGDEMISIDFVTFLEFLSVYNMKYASYYGEENKILMEVTGEHTENFVENLAPLIYYHPITELTEEPDVSDIDLIEEMSNID